MVQLNTPYPATAYLLGFLRQHQARLGLELAQADAALGLFLRLYSAAGLTRIGAALGKGRTTAARGSAAVAHVRAHLGAYQATIEPVIRFLQGKDPSLALRIVGRDYLPEGPRFAELRATGADGDGDDPLAWAFGGLGLADRAKHLASLYVDDLADAVRDGVDPRFELARYGERLAASTPTFAPLAAALAGPPTLIDTVLDELGRELAAQHQPDLLGLTAPFPGNVYGALRLARAMRAARPGLRVVLGGGYVNTELRGLAEPALFDHVDFVTVDAGEAPMLALLEHLAEPDRPLHRTFTRERGVVRWHEDAGRPEVAADATGTPSYAGLPLGDYVSLVEMLNPMHRLWSDGRWNKLTVAHGCYWRRCTFCDVGLPYIGDYRRTSADVLVDRIEAMIAETGQTGFHFVDEAAPPAALEALAERLLARKVTVTWWGNVRFEKAFTPALCRLLARSGCVAITGGLEAASDRLLALMEKGVTVAQVARVTRAFTDAGIMVHAYLMYGFPTQTAQETVDALERVRQLFAEGCVQSAFWHRFAATVHSPIGKDPAHYGLRLPGRRASQAAPPFARNDLAVIDPTGVDHDALGAGLRRALYNFMHGAGLDLDVRDWFAEPGRRPPRWVPAAKVPPQLIAGYLAADA